MGSRQIKAAKKEEAYDSVGIDVFIERLKKVRALNCSPSYIGMDNYLYKKLFFRRSGIQTKFL